MAATLTPGFQVVALKIQEAEMMHGDVAGKLQSAVQDAHQAAGTYGNYVNHSGDGESGDCIYTSNGGMKKAPYEISSVGGKSTTNLDTDSAVDVSPTVSYDELADDDDHYTAMSEALKVSKIYTDLPLYERFIAKAERDAADDSSFAGKGKSFPILQPADVGAAVHAMGRAGSANYGMAQLKSNIIRIAKAKGFTSELPKAWRGDDAPAKEAATVAGGALRLVESVAFPSDITIREALTTTRQIKLIAPGKGASAFYPAEVLKRDGPKVFKAGTPMRIDHPTKAEEAARPEGSVKNWGAVLAKDAYWVESHKEGPGLYSEIKPFSDHAQTIDEKGEYAGVSIHASGDALMENGKQVMRDGLPVLARFTSAEGVDMVTRAGAGGMFLSESARAVTTTEEVSDMDAAELKKLRESVDASNARAELREARLDAREQGISLLESISLPQAAKADVMSRVLESVPMKDGALDAVKFKEIVTTEAKRVGALLASVTGAGKVTGMGSGLGAPIVVPEAKKPEEIQAHAVKTFMRLGLTESAAKAAVKGRAA